MVERKFERITTENGLSHNGILAICQDSSGFMWFGTYEGLNKYDGFKFKTYLNNPYNKFSLKFNLIEILFNDKESNLWVGDLDSIISKYQRNSDDFKNVEINIPNFNASNTQLMSIVEDNHGNFWIGTFGNGLIKFNKETFSIQQFTKSENDENSISSNYVSRLFVDSNDRIIIGTFDEGISILSLKDYSFKKVTIQCDEKIFKLQNSINFLFEDSRNNFWIGTKYGLKKFDLQKDEFVIFPTIKDSNEHLNSSSLSSMSEDKNGNIWIGTRYNGLLVMNYNDNSLSHFFNDKNNLESISSDLIWKIYNDSSNVTWIGTLGDGICKIDCEAKKFYLFDNFKDAAGSVSLENISCITEDDFNNLWIGTFDSGLFKLNLKNYSIKNFSLLPLVNSRSTQSVYVNCLFIDNNSDLWIGLSTFEIIRYSTKDEIFSNYKIPTQVDNEVFSIINDLFNPERYLLIATKESGILKFDKYKKEFYLFASTYSDVYKISCNITINLFYDSQGDLWITTYENGLNRINFKSKEVRIFKFDPNEIGCISANNITFILEDNNNVLWFGTSSFGLNKFDRNSESFESFLIGDVLTNSSIRGILEDKNGEFWISTNKGISKFDPIKKNLKKYYSGDGLYAVEFTERTCYKSTDGILFFGGSNGLTYFNPDEIKDNSYIPNVVITDFQIFNESVKPSPENPFLKKTITHTKEIIISYKESVFSFEFAALIYNNTLKNQYAYMMEGFDKDWVYCGTRRNATYTNLNPGEYIFRVKASNNDNIWNEEGTSIKIKITPPYWKTWWFKGLGLFSLLGATGLTYKQRMNKLERERQTQQEFSRKLLASQESERKRLANELHDSIAHDILIMKNNAVLGLKDSKDFEEAKSVLNEISEQSTSTLNDVRSISYNLHPHQIQALGLTKAIKSIIDKASKSTDIKFKFDEEIIDNIFSEENAVYLFRIIQEAISNIIKHSSATEAFIRISRLDKLVSIIISDNGKGFSMSKNLNKNSLGLSGISERVKMLGGKMKIESGEGTRIEIELPTPPWPSP